MATIVKEIENLSVNATIAGASAGAISQVFGYGSPIPILGYDVPSPLIFALVGSGASLVQKATRDMVIPYFAGDEALAPNTLAYIVSPLITGGAFTLIDVLLNWFLGGTIAMENVINMFLAGTVSQLIANSVEKPVSEVIEII